MRRTLSLALLLGACGNPREDAASELRRLHEAMQRHAARHGRYPATLDAALPASPTNLPHAPERDDVALHLVQACWSSAGLEGATPPDCAPVSPSAADDAPGTQPPSGIGGVLTVPADSPVDTAAGS
ncbi:MAG TPA: hypothetical protein VFR81_05035 [Longimicrobium sp.]|nr:hypothetical protein [Longimicrobium sp.]